jgi:phosphate transport system protein
MTTTPPSDLPVSGSHPLHGPHPHRPELDTEMQVLRADVMRLGQFVDRAIEKSIWGLTERNVDLCTAVIEADTEANDLERQVRELVFQTILTQAPVAGDLREIMGLLHMASELERMADHCVSIAKIARTLADLPPLEPAVDIPKMAQYCGKQVRDILAGVMARDVERARQVAARDDRVDRIYHRLFDELVQSMTDHGDNVLRATNLVFIAHHLERIADRVINIAEDLIFTETGVIEDLG